MTERPAEFCRFCGEWIGLGCPGDDCKARRWALLWARAVFGKRDAK
jgi:hypothetical protein